MLPITWRTDYDKFLEYSGNSGLTRVIYLSNMDSFFNTAGDRIISVHSIPGLIGLYKEYLTEKKVGYSSKRVSLAAFRKLVKMLGGDPSVVRIILPKKAKSGVKYLTEDQISAILNNMDESYEGIRDSAIFAIFSHIGLRLAELSNITLDDLDFERNRIHILGKNMKDGHVPIIKFIRPFLDRWLSVRPETQSNFLWLDSKGERLKRRAIQYRMSKQVKQFSKEFSTHSLRHTAATTLINNGVELKSIQTLLRHSSIRTTGDVYSHKDVDSVGSELDQVYGG